MKIAELLDRHRGVGPGFHFLRHALSFIIVAHHCRIAIRGTEVEAYGKGTAISPDFLHHLTYGQAVVELMRPGLFALVGMFFALSGFLVTGSALRNPNVRTFFSNRALRIVPALSVEVTLSALLLGPLVTTYALSDYFRDSAFWAYFQNILGIAHFELPGVFNGNPWPSMVNANMWTLAPEFWCYLITLFLMGTGLILKRRLLIVTIIIATVALTVFLFVSPDLNIRANPTHFAKWFIVFMFFVGMLFFLAAEHIEMSPQLFLASVAGYYFLTLFNVAGPVSGLFLAYCTVYLGFMAFPWFDRLLRDDLSYGMYLYGFPITQVTVFYLLPQLEGMGMPTQFGVIFPIVLFATLSFSFVSWKVIEKPALKLKKYTTSFMKSAPAKDALVVDVVDAALAGTGPELGTATNAPN